MNGWGKVGMEIIMEERVSQCCRAKIVKVGDEVVVV